MYEEILIVPTVKVIRYNLNETFVCVYLLVNGTGKIKIYSGINLPSSLLENSVGFCLSVEGIQRMMFILFILVDLKLIYKGNTYVLTIYCIKCLQFFKMFRYSLYFVSFVV